MWPELTPPSAVAIDAGVIGLRLILCRCVLVASMIGLSGQAALAGNPSLSGSCCLPSGACMDEMQADCATASGNYLGDGTSCTDNFPQNPCGCCQCTGCSSGPPEQSTNGFVGLSCTTICGLMQFASCTGSQFVPGEVNFANGCGPARADGQACGENFQCLSNRCVGASGFSAEDGVCTGQVRPVPALSMAGLLLAALAAVGSLAIRSRHALRR